MKKYIFLFTLFFSFSLSANNMSIYEKEYCLKHMHHYLNKASEDLIDFYIVNCRYIQKDEINEFYELVSGVMTRLNREGPWEYYVWILEGNIKDMELDVDMKFLKECECDLKIADAYLWSLTHEKK